MIRFRDFLKSYLWPAFEVESFTICHWLMVLDHYRSFNKYVWGELSLTLQLTTFNFTRIKTWTGTSSLSMFLFGMMTYSMIHKLTNWSLSKKRKKLIFGIDFYERNFGIYQIFNIHCFSKCSLRMFFNTATHYRENHFYFSVPTNC